MSSVAGAGGGESDDDCGSVVSPCGGSDDGCRIVVSVAEPGLDSLREVLARVEGADLVEVRLDALENPCSLNMDALRDLVAAAPAPPIFTCRPRWHGGGHDGPEDDRRELLERAAQVAPYVDIELDAEWAAGFVARRRERTILSHHWDAPSPADFSERAARLRGLAPAIAKLVAPATELADCLPLLETGCSLVGSGQPAAAFCSGNGGRASRILAAAHGGALVYAASPGSAITAEGQWPAAELRDRFRLPRWRLGFQVCGLIGDPIEHSLSPGVFNAAFAEAGLDIAYVPLASDKADSAMSFARAIGIRGLSVTMPFKQNAARRCAELTAHARSIGAVNTLVLGPGGWSGHNTDATAAHAALASLGPVAGRKVVLLGAGGAARAAAVALAGAGAEVVVLNREPRRAAEVAALVDGGHGPLERMRDENADIVVNATPVGMAGGGATPVPTDWLRGEEVVLDMVYRPEWTVFLRKARGRGCRVVPGLDMFVRQAGEQFRLWTGVEPPAGALERAARAELDDDAGT